MQGVTVRTVAGYQATYAETANSADLVDRRHFNGGQQTAYQMDVHKPALVRCVTLNLVHGEPSSERRLAEQLGRGVDDRTVGRHLQAMGWRAAEAAGLSEEVAAYLEAEQQRAYWAGVAGQPLETTSHLPVSRLRHRGDQVLHAVRRKVHSPFSATCTAQKLCQGALLWPL